MKEQKLAWKKPLESGWYIYSLEQCLPPLSQLSFYLPIHINDYTRLSPEVKGSFITIFQKSTCRISRENSHSVSGSLPPTNGGQTMPARPVKSLPEKVIHSVSDQPFLERVGLKKE
ncbi:MAG: hypothetical protein WD335_00015 [Candidatus Paceibacterota bacterium]